MKGWRWVISGSSRPLPAVPVNLAPLTSRRGNPEAAAAAQQKHRRNIAVSIILLVYSVYLRTRQTLVTVVILHTQRICLSQNFVQADSVRTPRPRQHNPNHTVRFASPHSRFRRAYYSPLEAAF